MLQSVAVGRVHSLLFTWTSQRICLSNSKRTRENNHKVRSTCVQGCTRTCPTGVKGAMRMAAKSGKVSRSRDVLRNASTSLVLSELPWRNPIHNQPLSRQSSPSQIYKEIKGVQWCTTSLLGMAYRILSSYRYTSGPARAKQLCLVDMGWRQWCLLINSEVGWVPAWHSTAVQIQAHDIMSGIYWVASRAWNKISHSKSFEKACGPLDSSLKLSLCGWETRGNRSILVKTASSTPAILSKSYTLRIC